MRQPPPKPAPKPPSEIKFDLPKASEPGFTLPSTRTDEGESRKRPARDTSPKFDFSKARVIKPVAPRRSDPPAEDAERLAAERQRSRIKDLARTIAGASGSLAQSASRGAVQIQVSAGGSAGGGGGGGGGGSAYAWALRNAYDNAWVAPQGVTDDLATTEVEVVIRRDGRVISGRIVKRSGIAALDRSVRDALNRVTQAPAFEPGATEDQRTFTIGFNMRGKRSF